MNQIKYGNTTIEYHIVHKEKKKDVSILIEYQTGVTVITPPHISDEQVFAIVMKKAPAILRKLHELEEIKDEENSRLFISGEKIPYLGRHYKLKVLRDANIDSCHITFHHGKFQAHVPATYSDAQRIQELSTLFKSWYIKMGARKLQQRATLYSAKLGISPQQITVKDQEKSWGTCTPSGNIHINWRIFTAPMSVVDYVLVHELCHLKYLDHSEEFWCLLSSLIPDYEQRKEWLRVHGPNLKL